MITNDLVCGAERARYVRMYRLPSLGAAALRRTVGLSTATTVKHHYAVTRRTTRLPIFKLYLSSIHKKYIGLSSYRQK